MAGHYDKRETRDDSAREKDLMKRLPQVIAAAMKVPAWRRHLGKIDPRAITTRSALAELPVQRKSDMPALQKAQPPFGGFVPGKASSFGRLFMSPGPIFEPEAIGHDVWRVGRAMSAAGFRRGDIVLNTLSYHLTPGAWCFDSGARAVGCAVIPAGPGNTDAQLDLIEAYRPSCYAGTPDFLKILLDAAKDKGRDASSIKRALVGGAAFPASLQKEVAARGVDAYQTYAIAECGVIAYESEARQGLILNEDIILEIVRPGTGNPVAPGEVGEIVVTVLDPHHPLIRFATGDLTAILPDASPCGRTNSRIKGWLGRADQTAKVKGMFVRPEQVAEVVRRHPEIARARLVVARNGESDAMTLKVESRARSPEFVHAVGESLLSVMKLKGGVEAVKPGSLPNDGKVIEDTRPVG
ncbi:phenylacetate--CoA ligase family protein [Phreatobacter sp. HK31-P]